MTAINIFDTLRFDPTDSSDIGLRVVLAGARTTDSAQAAPIPTGAENLVVRAAQLLKEFARTDQRVQISLIKRIPSAAGLGGGSSDAAATLAGLNRFWNLNLTQTTLLDLAAQLGSDIGFFLGGSSTAVCRGRGELVEPLRLHNCFHFVVAKPGSGLSTAKVFSNCCPGDHRQSVDAFVETLNRPGLSRMVRLLLNDLQTPAETLNEEVRELRRRFDKLPVLGHQMSGSGSSYFGVCASSRHAQAVAARLRASGVPWVRVAKTCP